MIVCFFSFFYQKWWNKVVYKDEYIYFQTFSELIEAASNGDRHGVDQFSNDLVKGVDAVEGEESFYTKAIEEGDVEPTLVFCFGKAIGSDLGTAAAVALTVHCKNIRVYLRIYCGEFSVFNGTMQFC